MPRRLALAAASIALACTVSAAPPAVTLTPVVSGLSAPTEIAVSGLADDRLFVVQQGGRIRIVENGAIRTTDFLDIASLISLNDERGLLGMAFHPQYATNGAFYVYYTRPDGALVIARYLRNPDGNTAGNGAVLLSIPHSQNANHNGGRLVFGPDGYLYIGTGDGGGSGDPLRAGQDLATRLGKILRIAVDGGAGYTIPPGNPFAGDTCGGGRCPEILHYGVRNPWKLSFDRATGDLYIADVGQNAIEEVNHLPVGTAPGQNLGWGIYEGTSCFNNNYFGPAGACAALTQRLDPVITYGHNGSGGFSITGGYVYRGTRSAGLRGYYLYGDFVSNRVWASRKVGASWEVNVLIAPGPVSGVSTFGEDRFGDIYVASYNAGTISRIDGDGPTARTAYDFSGDARADVLWRNATTGEMYQWQMNGGTIAAQGYLPTVAAPWNVAALGDLDGDGRADVLWRNASTGENYAWLLDGLSIMGQAFLPTVPAPWGIAGLSDADGDGRADVFWRNAATGENYLWLMNGVTIAGQAFLPAVGAPWSVAAIVDFSGDGRADVLWRNGTTGDNYQWQMNGLAISSQGFLPAVVDTSWEVVANPDANGDGRADVFWRHAGNGANYLWLLDGLSIASQVYLPTVADANWRVGAFGDFGGSGTGSILWRNAADGSSYFWALSGIAIASQGFLPSVPAGWTPIRR